MIRHFFGASLLVLALAACGGGDETENTDPSAEAGAEAGSGEADLAVDVDTDAADGSGVAPPPSLDIDGLTISKLLGTFEGDVTGLALSRNIEFGGGGTVLAANADAGIALVPITEDQQPTVFLTEGDNYRAVASTIVGTNPMVAAESVLESGATRLQFMTITASANSLVSIASQANDRTSPAAALCFAGQSLIKVAENGDVLLFTIAVEDTGPEITAAGVLMSDAQTCADGGDRVYVLGTDGTITTLGLDGETMETDMPMAEAPAGTVDFAVMPHDDTASAFFVLEDGQVQIGEQTFSFAIDGEMVGTSQISASAGNFGAVYRNGIMAVLSTDNQLGIVSWLSVANALDLPSDTNERAAPEIKPDPMPAAVEPAFPDLSDQIPAEVMPENDDQ